MRVLILLALFAVFAFADPVPYTNCGVGNDSIIIKTFDLTPWPPVMGESIVGALDVYVQNTISAGTYELTATFNRMKIIDASGDLAELMAKANVTLPLPAGSEFSWNIDQVVPVEPLTGTIDASVTAKDVYGNIMFCFELKFKPVKKAAFGAVDSNCETVSNEGVCQETTEDDGTPCVWCNSKTLPSSCMNETSAKILPPSVFACEFPSLFTEEDSNCENIKNEKSCQATTEDDGTPCVWCNSKTLPSSCMNETSAQILPPSVFACDLPVVTVTEEDSNCENLKSEVACESTTEDDGTPCVWCNSKTLPSSCMNETSAQILPPSVFACNLN